MKTIDVFILMGFGLMLGGPIAATLLTGNVEWLWLLVIPLILGLAG